MRKNHYGDDSLRDNFFCTEIPITNWYRDMIEPFFFGPRDAIAFYHPPADPTSEQLMIICPPLFDEYKRCYRALGDLTNACSSEPQGPHVIRIDYTGTGDAFGELSHVSVDDWLDDINHAIEEGMSISGASIVILVGVRFGATLVAQCCHSAVKQYILWDPIDKGIEYLQFLDHLNSLIQAKHIHYAREINQKHEDIPYVCYELSEKLTQGISALTTEKLYSDHSDKVWITTTHDVKSNLNNYPILEFSGFKYDWPPFHEGNLIPKPVLESIAKRVFKK